MNEFLGAIVPIARIGQDEAAPEKEDFCDALFPDRRIRVSHFNRHLCTAESYSRWCNFFYLEI